MEAVFHCKFDDLGQFANIDVGDGEALLSQKYLLIFREKDSHNVGRKRNEG